MSKNNESYGLTAGHPGMETHSGTWVSASEHGIHFKHRKSGSSTMVTRFIPADKVIACLGKIGGDAELIMKTDYIPIFRSGKKGKEKPLEVTGMSPLGVMLKTQSEQFKDIVVHRDIAEFISEEKDNDAPKRGRKAAEGGKKEKKEKKEKVAKPKGKAAKGEDWE